MTYVRIFLYAVVVLSLPGMLYASTVVRTGESVSLSADQSVEGDFYGAAETAALSGTILGDAYVAGGSVTINGQVEEDLTVFSGTVQVHAEIADDVRVAAGEITIAEHVGGDVFVLGGYLKILSTATIEGDVFFYGGEAELNGEIKGNVHGAFGSMRIDGPVRGDVDVHAGELLTLGDRADISGDVRYTSTQDLIRAQNAVVVGDMIKNSPTTQNGERNVGVFIVPFLILLFSSLAMYLLFKRELQQLVSDVSTSYGRVGLFGFAGIVCIPIAIGLLCVSVLGLVIGLMSFFAFLLAILITLSIGGILFGGVLQRMITKKTELTLLWTCTGVLLYSVLLVIPVIGQFLVFVIFVLTFGSLLNALYRRFA